MKTSFTFLLLIYLIIFKSFSQTGWQTTTFKNTMDLGSVCFVNDSVGYAAGYMTVIKTHNGGVNWVVQNINGYIKFSSVYGIDENTVFVMGTDYAEQGAKIYRTTNGGNDWVETAKFYHKQLTQMCFQNSTTGLAVGTDEHLNGLVYKTSDGGLTWLNKNIISGPMLL